MPLNVKRFCTSVLLTFTFSILIVAQTSADVMRDRVAKAKAYIATRNYGAAIYELENIRRETSDQTVHNVINVLLMNSYLEQGDYKRAQDFLNELAKKPGAAASYLAAAGQVVKGARNQMERYRALGLSVSDPKLPKDAVADVDKMRETLEKVVEQSKVLGKDKNQTSNAMALMEEATAARGGLARDDFDANRWKNEAADAREDLANSRSVVINAVNETPSQSLSTNTVAANTPPQPTITPVQMPISLPIPPVVAKNNPTENLPANQTPQQEVKKTVEPSSNTVENSMNSTRIRRVDGSDNQTAVIQPNVANNENKTETLSTMQTEQRKDTSPIAVGSLVSYATEKSSPVYPPMARNMRMTGVVKVDLIIDEKGKVVEVQNTSGPAMLQQAATDAVKKWRFKPFVRDGQATKATGFVSFNFSL